MLSKSFLNAFCVVGPALCHQVPMSRGRKIIVSLTETNAKDQAQDPPVHPTEHADGPSVLKPGIGKYVFHLFHS